MSHVILLYNTTLSYSDSLNMTNSRSCFRYKNTKLADNAINAFWSLRYRTFGESMRITLQL